MVVVNETKRGQLLALLEQCAHLNADVRPRTDKGYFTVTVPVSYTHLTLPTILLV